MDLGSLRSSADAACRLMKVLSNPDRLLLLCQLAQGEMRVGELEESVGILQPTLSQQLGVLRDEGLVSTRRDGKAIYYRIDSPQALDVMKVLYDQFCSVPGKKRALMPAGTSALACCRAGAPARSGPAAPAHRCG
jgi:DNA-binding transcriptional ArsR family regulator